MQASRLRSSRHMRLLCSLSKLCVWRICHKSTFNSPTVTTANWHCLASTVVVVSLLAPKRLRREPSSCTSRKQRRTEKQTTIHLHGRSRMLWRNSEFAICLSSHPLYADFENLVLSWMGDPEVAPYHANLIKKNEPLTQECQRFSMPIMTVKSFVTSSLF